RRLGVDHPDSRNRLLRRSFLDAVEGPDRRILLAGHQLGIAEAELGAALIEDLLLPGFLDDSEAILRLARPDQVFAQLQEIFAALLGPRRRQVLGEAAVGLVHLLLGEIEKTRP